MVSFDADPLDGPKVSTSDPAGTLKESFMYIVGAGVFFALLATAQSTVTPAVQGLLSSVPMLNSGGADSGMIQFGNPES